MDYEVKYMKLWEHPNNYSGETYEDYYVLLGQHRDSDILDTTNFEAALEILGGESEHVIVARAGHWAVGWCETLLIHKDAPDELLQRADEMIAGLEDYPVLDDDAFYAAEYEESQRAIEDFNPVRNAEWDDSITDADKEKWEELKEEVFSQANGYDDVYCWLRKEWDAYEKGKCSE